MIKTYRYRVKDKHTRSLNRMARDVNFVWNFCNDTQKHALRWGKSWPSGFDLAKLTKGSSIMLTIKADAIREVCIQYARSRRQYKRPYLRYRGQRSLGWIPVRGRAIKPQERGFVCQSKNFDVFLSRKIPNGAKICDGSGFSQDARGRWFLNIAVQIPETEQRTPQKAVGIDLGLKDLATLSDGSKIEAPQYFRKTEQRLAKAQRARKKRQVQKIHDKIKAQRRDFLHKAANDIVAKNDLIVVGNVNSSGLKRTRMGKSVSDVGWYSFKQMLAYKSIANGARFIEVNEAYTTQTCSACGSISGPKGRKGLGVREWSCDCGAVHNRDVNAAQNILRLGSQAPKGAVL